MKANYVNVVQCFSSGIREILLTIQYSRSQLWRYVFESVDEILWCDHSNKIVFGSTFSGKKNENGIFLNFYFGHY